MTAVRRGAAAGAPAGGRQPADGIGTVPVRAGAFLAMELVVAAAATRLLPHPPNFTSVGAMALFGGACLRPRAVALVVPLVAMVVGDVGMGWLAGDWSLAFHPLVPAVYGSFVVATLIGVAVGRRRTARTIASGALGGAAVFFLVTNFANWLAFPTFPRTWEGLVACYAAGLPYLRNTLAGDAFYATVMFGSLAWVERRGRAADATRASSAVRAPGR